MNPRRGRLPLLAVLSLLALTPKAWSQGFIIDRHIRGPIAQSFEIREVSVDARIRSQVAEVQVSQTFHNPGSFVLESEYLFPLPEEGAIQNFVLMVDGKELPGRLLPKDEARRIYEEVVRSKRDPALLEYMGRGLFRTSVFPIPPGADRKVTLRYTQICPRDRDVVTFAYPFGTQKFTAKPIQRLVLNLRIESGDAIKSIYSPTSEARIDRTGDHDARISFERFNVIPANDFRLLYTLSEGSLGASVLSYRPDRSDDGYFLILASPQVKAPDRKPQPKAVVFVLDRSGSMAGKKIEQARKALEFVLNNLHEQDLFNIVAYDDRVEAFKPKLQQYTPASRTEAVRYIENIREGGATNIDEALQTALDMIRDDARPSYVLFLTDGLPTAGETAEMTISEHCRRANRRHARVFAFGVGFDVNARLLDRISGGNSGTSEYVKPDEDIETHVARFYGKMTSPVLTDIRITLGGTDVNRTYPRDLPDLFEGGQLILAGRYRQGGKTTLRLSGNVGSDQQDFEFPADLDSGDKGRAYDFVERIWAIRRVGDIIDQIDLHGRSKELVDELVSLSTKYGILTPYTSFLADERVPLHHESAMTSAGLSLNDLAVVSGPRGVEQRSDKRRLMEAQRPQAPALYSGPAVAANDGFEGLSRGSQAQSFEFEAKRSGANLGESVGRMPSLATGGAGGTAAKPTSLDREPSLAVRDAGGRERAVRSVRQVGSKTFYWKNRRWVDSAVTPELDARALVVAQFSDAFFALARTQDSERNQYLSFDEPVTVLLEGKVYRIDPAPTSGAGR